MFPKFAFFLLIFLVCKTCFAQDSVFYLKQKVQENIKNEKNGQHKFLESIVSGNKTGFDFNPYDIDYTELQFSARNSISSAECFKDLATVALDVLSGQEYAFMMLDSQGKQPAGIFYWNIRWMGFYEECLRAEKVVDGEVKIKGKYCTSRTELSPFLGSKGICVPDSCNARDLQTLFDLIEGSGAGGLDLPDVLNCVEDIPWITGDYVTLVICGLIGLILFVATVYDVVLRLNKNKKDSTKQSKNSNVEFKGFVQNGQELSQNGTILSHSAEMQNGATNGKIPNGHENGGFTTINDEEGQKSSTTENRQTPGNKPTADSTQVSKKTNLGIEILLCFSVLTNGEKLFSFSSGGNQLQAINGIRSLSFGWVVLGHTYTFLFMYIDNIAETDFFMIRPSFQILINGTYSVDTFFFLSGLLVAYSTIKLLKKTSGKLNWPMFYVHRYIRLTAIYGFTILLMATLWRHVVKGIFQNRIDEGRSAEADPVACQKYWWTNILYINNFYPNINDAASCHGVGWYMANDMQLFIISPIYIYLLYRKPLIGHLLVLSGIVTSFMATGIISDKYDLSSLMFGSEAQNADQSYYGWMIYSRPYYRMGAYLVGISAGELLLHKPKLNKVFIVIGWVVAIGLHYLLIFGMYPLYRDGGISMSTEMDALYNATHRSVWALSLAWVVYACAHGLGGPINWFLSWNIWGPIARISFAGYLTHQWVLLSFITGLQQLVHLNDFSAAMLFTATMTVVLPVAAVLSLAIEAPVMRLQKLLLASK